MESEISRTWHSEIILKAPDQEVMTQTMNVNVEKFACSPDKKYIKLHGRWDIFWKSLAWHGEESLINSTQAFSDKS